MASIGSLVVDMAVNTGKFETDLRRAAKASEKRSREMQRNFEEMGKKIALAAVAAATAIGAMALKAIEAGDNLAKAASKSGIAIKAFSELAYAAQLSDVDLNSLSAALKKMQVALSQAGTGSKEVNRALQALGLSLGDLASLSPDKQFELLADRINKLKDPADRTRAAVEIFGKAGADLLPLFESGAAGIRAAREEAEALGKTLDEKGAKSIQDADTAIKKMKAASEGLAQALAIKLGPAIVKIADALRILAGGATDIEKITRKLEFLRETSESLGFLNLGFDEKLPTFALPGEIDKRIAELEKLRRLKAPAVTHSRGSSFGVSDKFVEPVDTPGFAAAEAAIEAQKEWAKQSKDILDTVADAQAEVAEQAERAAQQVSDSYLEQSAKQQEARDEMIAKDQEYLEFVKEFYRELDDQTKTSAEKQAEAIKEFQTKVDILVSNGLDPETAKKRVDEFKKTFDEMSVYADQAARNMQDAFSDFLFDPFSDGLKGMLRGFIDTIRRMVAEAAAAKLFSSKSSGGLGLGDLISTGLGALFGGKAKGLATGTNYVPKDNFPALLHKGEAVVPAAYNPAAGGQGIGGVSITNNVDARGATADAISLLPEVLRRNNESLEAKIIEGIRRGRYALG